MDNNLRAQYLIDQMLLQRLSIPENAEFQQLVWNAEFRKDLEFQKQVFKVIEATEDQRLLAVLGKEEQVQSRSPLAFLGKNRLLMVSIVILLIVLAILVIFGA